MAYISAGNQHKEIFHTGNHKVLLTATFSADIAIYMHHAPMVLCGGGGFNATHIFFPALEHVLLKDCIITGTAHYRDEADFCDYAADYPAIQDVCPSTQIEL
jgi:hypothetical protein